jgi:FAD:protein FMN transferase
MMQAFSYRHAAMATEFELVLAQEGLTEQRGQNIANEIFADIDKLEDELSKFRSTSDIWRLSRLTPGRELSLSHSAWDCLSLAKAVHQATDGALDVTVGKLMELWRNPDKTLRTPSDEQIQEARRQVGDHLYELDPAGLLARVLEPGLQFDLGAIGKGYALDQAVTVLEEWGLSTALLSAGESTILALGSPRGDQGWPVDLRTDPPETVWLRDRALSCSGFSEQGQHIMDPRTGKPVTTERPRTYVLAPTAALSDALSTAFAVMTDAEIRRFCAKEGQIEWLGCSDVQA